ncbi:GPR180/TMEM145 transmembrane domain-containing protein [Caenorhabditis elegans]|uniref:GPR180/TMEM145 transmembrane domain-containing protein n=1 Tax=Caenorhabditis elegans TaxID=6239 RepID=Q18000_CAEEL|nr:GPR180/TMEM145 transmembrane domain-containing protein [Caenorhabditis elegans]CAA91531.3 GPR180/TMEM145 transmembrane domain-containing protein [Caenorhabditis elegans]|eukprot:NP_510017.3 Uncharacterized protein CELE_C15A7.2 [Caenorhabditis elegans]
MKFIQEKHRLVFLLTTFCYHIYIAQGKRAQGILSSKRDFVYLDRFCFQSDTGALEYTFRYPMFYPTQMLLLYFDTEDQWPRAYKELNTCEDRVQLLANHSENHQIIYLSPYALDSSGNGRCQIHSDGLGQQWIACSGTRVFRSARSRWWFLAIANCDPSESEDRRLYNNESIGIYAEFTLQMTNGLPTEVLKYQFSIDEWLILPSDTLFLGLQSILIVCVFLMGKSLSARRLYHNTFRMCSQSITMNTIGLGFLVTNYIIYAIDGIGLPIILTSGQFIRALADMLFMYMCLVLARGLNVTKMLLSWLDKLFLVGMFIVFICSYLLMQFWEIKFFDPAEVYAQSESLPAYLLVIWRLTAWVFFVVAALMSRSDSPQKSAFFTSFVFLMTPWFWAPPIFTMIANFCLNNWVRAEVVNIVDNIVTFYGYIIFLYLSRPSDNNQNFPFHIRTTQVDVDVGFDPQRAYAENNGNQTNDGMHGVIELTVTNMNTPEKDSDSPAHSDDRGVLERPQIASS